MKQLFLLLLMLAVPKCVLAQTAKALWCSDQTALVFVYDDNTYAAGSTVTTHGETYTVTESYAVTRYKPSWVNGDDEPTTQVQDNTTMVIFAESYDTARPTTTHRWFDSFINLTEVVGIEHLHTDQVTSMEKMFAGCNNLEALDVSGWNTSNVTNMGSLFSSCIKLKTLDVSKDVSNPDKWNTQNVKTLFRTFMYCKALETLDVSGWATDSLTNLESTFDGCQELETLDVSGWHTEKVINMNAAFRNCSKVKELNVGNWNTDNLTVMSHLFENCTVSKLDVSKWNRSGKLKNLHWTFKGCKNVSELNVSQWHTENVTDMQQLFCGCSNLTKLPVSNWNTASLRDFSRTFMGCKGLITLNLSKWNTSNVTTMEHTFSGCIGLENLIVSGNDWNTSNLTNMSCTFLNCRKLSTIDISSWNTANVKRMEQTFQACNGLKGNYTFSGNTANVTTMVKMFDDCNGLTSITFGEGFNTDHLTKADNMFGHCPKLRYIDFYASNDANAITEVDRTTVDAMFHDVPTTTVIYLPHGSQDVTGVRNVIYSCNGDETDLRCPNYYSADKTDIEFPRDFRTNKAEYSRTMSTNYGSVVLPYAFKTNDDIQAYTLDEEHTETMYFVDADEIPAHTPFAFKKLGNAEFINEDATGNFGITVKATRSTNKDESTWDPDTHVWTNSTTAMGAPYTSSEHLDGWTTKGYYVTETVSDYDGAFYIAGDKFYKADGALTMYPHRVTFHGAWNTEPSSDSPAKFFEIATVSKPTEEQPEDVTPETDDLGLADAIEAAELRKEIREAAAIYDAQGRKQNELKRGLNIIREQDGSMKKVIIR